MRHKGWRSGFDEVEISPARANFPDPETPDLTFVFGPTMMTPLGWLGHIARKEHANWWQGC